MAEGTSTIAEGEVIIVVAIAIDMFLCVIREDFQLPFRLEVGHDGDGGQVFIRLECCSSKQMSGREP